MKTTNKVRAALTTAVVVLGIGAGGIGVAFAAPEQPPPPAAQPAEGDALVTEMDQMMQQMVRDLPADQRDAATRMHEQMRPAMQQMMSGDMSGMDQMDQHHGQMPPG